MLLLSRSVYCVFLLILMMWILLLNLWDRILVATCVFVYELGHGFAAMLTVSVLLSLLPLYVTSMSLMALVIVNECRV